jgi:hypothetical protein
LVTQPRRDQNAQLLHLSINSGQQHQQTSLLLLLLLLPRSCHAAPQIQQVSLPYALNALEPEIDNATMNFHVSNSSS